MEDINLHFTGDFHAIGAANNLLAAMVDNHIYWGNELGIDSRRVTWRRGLDMNDRALRSIVSSLGGVANGFPREDGFDIVVASEVMAIFCLASDLADLKRRLGNIVVGQTRAREPVRAERAEGGRRDGGAAEGRDRAEPRADAGEQPGLHPWRAVRQHRAWLQLGDRDEDRAEAGRLRRDRGRVRGRSRRREVLRHQVPQGRAEAGRGGRRRHRAGAQDAWRRAARPAARRRTSRRSKPGSPTWRGISKTCAASACRRWSSVNRFSADTEAEHAKLKELCAAHGVEAVIADHWAYGGEGAAPLAEAVVARYRAARRPISSSSIPTRCRCATRSRRSRRRSTGRATSPATARSRAGWPNCRRAGSGISRSASPRRSTASRPTPTPRARRATISSAVREIRLSAGAEFVVAVCGEIMTMPGLPRVPAANSIDLTEDGRITGLF